MSTGHGQAWRGVPEECLREWYAVFAGSREGLNVSSPCPVCGARTLHRYYQHGKKVEVVADGELYVSRGASWEWCSTCRPYEHATALVPAWWSGELEVELSKLTAEPEALEAALRQA